MKEFRNRTAVITGAASGIGLELARRAAAEGMKLVLADIEAARLDAAAASLGIDADRILAQPTDVSREDEVKDLAAAASELRRRRLSGRVETVRVTPDADPTWVIVVR